MATKSSYRTRANDVLRPEREVIGGKHPLYRRMDKQAQEIAALLPKIDRAQAENRRLRVKRTPRSGKED